MNTYQQIVNILAAKTAEEASVLAKEISLKVGYWDKAGRYFIYDQHETSTSSNVRVPSRNFPFSAYKHVLTKKFWKSYMVEHADFLEADKAAYEKKILAAAVSGIETLPASKRKM